MLVERQVPKELKYRNRSPRRAPRMPGNNPAERSLVNCNQLARTDTKNLPEETVGERLAREIELHKKVMGRRKLYKTLKESLKAEAIETQSADLARPWGARDEPDKGPWSAAKDFRRLEACQTEWIGYKASCCSSPAIAVPIGCNHRLCPLCNASRLERYRGKARLMLEKMKNPAFLTLTVPNVTELNRQVISNIRVWWKEFYRRHKQLLQGGLYSIEITFNRENQTWHPHLHIVFDSPFPVRGMKPADFRKFKQTIEFSWLRITSREAKRAFRRDEFDRWDDERSQQRRGSDWNLKYRRTVDIRAVENDSSAVYELIKYISKSNRFLDLPKAVAAYLRAVRNVRVLQTFGSFYNFKFEIPLSQNDLAALAALGVEPDKTTESSPSFFRCDCGQNQFKSIGFFSMKDVEMAETGRWLIRSACQDKGRWSNKPMRERRRCRGSAT